jgi:hypothetical protein
MTSIIKVDNLQNQCGANIISESANVITIGASGDTVTLAAGASQSGFGRTGTVNWDTTKKTTGFTSVSGNGYFCDTTSSAFTATLPATPSAGAIVAFSDYTGTWTTNNITVGRNGSNINATAADLILNGNNTTATFIYVDATEGWRVIDTGSLSEVNNIKYVAATGGTITTCGDYKIHTFTGPGTFTVSCAGNPLGSTTVDYLVVAGGGSGGFGVTSYQGGGGGGAGGYRESSGTASGSYTVSPLGSGVSALPVSVTGYPITVGAGGATSTQPSNVTNQGSPSVFSTITSTAGGGGGIYPAGDGNGNNGGSGGGGGSRNSSPGAQAGTGNSPPVAPAQGTNGGNGNITAFGPGNPHNGGGGGGATVAGTAATGPQAGPGGTGATSSINTTPTARAGGGGGGSQENSAGTASGGGGAGGANNAAGSAGTVNTGGGGGGGANNGCGERNGGAGGSGIVVIRYKFQ